MKAHEIIPGRVYQRGEFRRRPTEWKWDGLRSMGVTGVVCLHHADPDLQGRIGLRYWHKYIPDGAFPRVNRVAILEMANAVGNSLLNDRNNAVLVHCQGGKNRASLFTALLCVRLLSMPGKAALAHVRAQRPGAVDNRHFEKFLNQVQGYWEKEQRYLFEGGRI